MSIILNISKLRERYFSSGSFAANTLTLMVGTSIAQAIPMLVSPIITRLYSPKEYGLFALFASVGSILAVVATARYETTVMLPAEDNDAIHILVLTLIIASATSFLFLLLIIVFEGSLVALINDPEFSAWIYFIPLFVILTAGYQPMNYWLNRKKRYRLMSSRTIIQTITASLIQLCLGIIGLTRIGLFVGAFTGHGVALSLVGWQIWRNEKKTIMEVELQKMKAKAKEYKDFPLYAAPTSLLGTILLQAPILFLTYAFGSFQVGLFSLTLRVLALPASLIGTAVGQVYHQRIAEMRHDRPEELTPFILRSAKYLALIVALPVLIIGFLGPLLFSFVFGEQWRNAGVFAQIISVAVGIKFVVSPLSTIMSVTNNVKVGSYWNVLCFCTTSIVLYIGTFFEIDKFLLLYTFHEVILYLYLFHLIIRASRQANRSSLNA